MTRAPTATPRRSFRLSEETLAELDAIALADGYRHSDGSPNRTGALRVAVQEAAKRRAKKNSGKNGEPS